MSGFIRIGKTAVSVSKKGVKVIKPKKKSDKKK
jgi:hypothetical protein